MAVAGQMKDVVDRARAQCEKFGIGEDPLPEDLRVALEKLKRYLFARGSVSLSD